MTGEFQVIGNRIQLSEFAWYASPGRGGGGRGRASPKRCIINVSDTSEQL